MSNTLPKTDAGIFLWMTWQAIQAMGLDCQAIFASVGMDGEAPDTNQRRINSPQARFWQAAEAVSGDPDIGLHTAERMPPFRGQVLEYLFLSSPTFEEGLYRAVRYGRLLSDALDPGVSVEGDRVRLYGFDHPVRHYLEAAVLVVVRFLEHVTDGDLQPKEIWLPHASGASDAEYRRVFGCPVRLGMEEGAILFGRALMARPSPAAEPELLAVHENLAQQRLADLERRDRIARVEQELGDLLERGDVSLERVAERLGVTPRALKEELSEAGMPFRNLVARYRERLARRLLARTDEPLDQIIYLTGFSEPAAFTRAFKRWTGETPTAYRQRRRGE